jgi:hypothetical protein
MKATPFSATNIVGAANPGANNQSSLEFIRKINQELKPNVENFPETIPTRLTNVMGKYTIYLEKVVEKTAAGSKPMWAAAENIYYHLLIGINQIYENNNQVIVYL